MDVLDDVGFDKEPVPIGIQRAFLQADRCETCGAQAWARAIVCGSELLYCIHHWRKYEEKLVEVASDWHVDYEGFNRLT